MGNENSQQLNLAECIENDIHVTWKKSEKETPFAARDGHCGAAVGSKLYIFGGVHSIDGDVHETKELLCYDLETASWIKVVSKGDAPPARFAGTMSAVGSSLYLFGGLSQDCGWFDDVHKFDTETSMWSRVEAEGEGPSPRDKLASAVIGNDIYIFGGFGPQVGELEEVSEESEDDDEAPQDQDAAQFTWFDDLFVFNTSTNTWSNPIQMNLQKPSPRAAMSMCAVDIYLCVFGGRDADARRNDIHIFNTVSRKWETTTINGRQPAPRSYHTATTVGKRVVVLGGRGIANQHFADFNIFDVETMQWLQPAIQGAIPAARGVHTATLVGDQLVVFGGSSEFNPSMNQCIKYFNDLHFVPTKEITMGTPKAKVACTNVTRSVSEPGPTGDSACIPESSSTNSQSTSVNPEHSSVKHQSSSVEHGSNAKTETEQEGPSPAKKSKLDTEKS